MSMLEGKVVDHFPLTEQELPDTHPTPQVERLTVLQEA